MNYELLSSRYPLPPEALGGYLIRGFMQIPLNVNQIGTELLESAKRRKLKTPITGDCSLIIYYKNKEGALLSLEVQDDELRVVQLQGAKSSKSYRLCTGLRWPDLLADELVWLANQPDSGVRRVRMVNPLLIEGAVAGKSEEVIMRYESFAARALLRWSQDESAYIRDLKVR